MGPPRRCDLKCACDDEAYTPVSIVRNNAYVRCTSKDHLGWFKLSRILQLFQAFLGSQDIGRDFNALEAVLREAARQVASHCSEQGGLLIKVGSGAS